ncbi:MAG: PspC domain-containing protein [Trueperaceae bacterium]|nr:PspC domain-containing protein [Trueperaceae bacterium]
MNSSRTPGDKPGTVAAEPRSAERRARHPEGTELRLRRSREGRVLLGLCAGIADYTKIDVSRVRLMFAVTGALTLGTLAIAYLLLSLMISPAPLASTAQA